MTEIVSRSETYTLVDPPIKGDFCDVYECSWGVNQGWLKIVRDSAHNPGISNEMLMLKIVSDEPRFAPYFPVIVDHFAHDDGNSNRQINVFEKLDGFFTLEQIHDAYPNGLDPKDFAWIYRRILVAIGQAHKSEIVHGAVTPQHVIVHPTEHGLVLLDWMGAGFIDPDTDLAIKGNSYPDWYPNEVTIHPLVDIMLAARTGIYLLGGDPKAGLMPDTIPEQMRAFLRGCLLTPATLDAWELLRDFDTLIEGLWGRRRYRPLSMP